MTTIRGRAVLGVAAGLCLSAALWAADAKSAPAGLSAEEIVQKNVAARGGVAAWHALQSMTWQGKMDAGYGDSAARSAAYAAGASGQKGSSARAARLAAPQGNAKQEAAKQVQLPFVLDMKRPGKSRVELEFAGKTSIQVYDGKEGWMKRPYLNRDDWEPFSAEQAKASAGQWDLDGPLMDYAARGTTVALAGVEKVDGTDAYKLKLTRRDGTVQHVWIDRKSFLDVKVEGTPRRMDGKLHAVSITQRDFRSVQGVRLPFLLETAVDGFRDTHQMVLEKVTLNPKLDDTLFTRPGA